MYDYINNMPADILNIAEEETLQYVLVDFNGETRPAITAEMHGLLNILLQYVIMGSIPIGD